MQEVPELQHHMRQVQSRSSANADVEHVPENTEPAKTGLTGQSSVTASLGQSTVPESKASFTTISTPSTADGCRSEQKDSGVTKSGVEVSPALLTTSGDLTSAFLAQQLPPRPKYSRNSESSTEDTFQEWLAQFKLVAEVCKWSPEFVGMQEVWWYQP